MWNPADHCKICYKFIVGNDFSNNEEREEERRKILALCSEYLFTELCDWKCISTKEKLPFCAECTGVIQQIFLLDEKCKVEQKDISNFSELFAVKVLRLRNKRQKEMFPKIVSGGVTIKVEKGEETMCKICHGMYNERPLAAHESLNLTMVSKVIGICRKYLFSEIFDDGSLDVDVIARLNLLPFCFECCIYIQDICQKDDSIVAISAQIESQVNTFAVQILNYRKKRQSVENTEKIVKVSSATPDISFRTAETPPVIQEEESDCMVVDRNCPSEQSTPLVEGAQHPHSDQASISQMPETITEPVTPVIEINTIKEVDEVVSVECEEVAKALVFPEDSSGLSTIRISNRSPPKGNYKCHSCGAVFMHKLNWHKHIESCFTNGNTFACETCGQCFSDTALFSDHLNSHSIPENPNDHSPSESEVTQPLVDPQQHIFPQKAAKLPSHPRVQILIKSHKCPRCGRSFLRRNHLTNHIKGNLCHSVENFKQLFHQTTLSRVRSHKKNFMQRGNVYSCSFCPLTFTFQPLFTRHLQTHFDIASVNKRCYICRKVFTTSGYRNRHFAKAHPENIDQNSANIDQNIPEGTEVVQNPADMDNIQESNRPKRKYGFKCTFCEQVFPRKYIMRQHMRREHYAGLLDGNAEHQNPTDPDYSPKRKRITKKKVYSYTCTVCEKLFTRKYLLRIHVIKQHAQNPSTQEMIQKENCNDPEGTVKHAKAKRCITKYTCSVCALRFGKIMELRNHLQTHYDEALHRCTTCKLVVNDYRSLCRHMDSVHV